MQLGCILRNACPHDVLKHQATSPCTLPIPVGIVGEAPTQAILTMVPNIYEKLSAMDQFGA
jgi:hypothetical protein